MAYSAERIPSQLVSPFEGQPTPQTVQWSQFFVGSTSMEDIVRQQERYFSNSDLQSTDLSDVGTRLFDNNTVVETTLRGISTKDPAALERIRGSLLQMGNKAYILLYEAVAAGERHHFVTYLSRFPEEDPRGGDARRDYLDLRSLAKAFETRLKPEAQPKYGVVKPLAFDHITVKEKRYPFFTMPFVPMGELAVNAALINPSARDGHTPGFPYFSYSVTYTDEMKAETQQHMVAATALAHAVNRGENPQILKYVEKEYTYRSQRKDLLRACSLVYLLSHNRFPKEHLINAGDWMADIGKDALSLRLITVRGGFSTPMTVDAFYERMLTHMEVPTLHNLSLHIFPFGGLKKTEFLQVVEEAKTLIK